MWPELIVVAHHKKQQNIWEKAFPIFCRTSHKETETTQMHSFARAAITRYHKLDGCRFIHTP